MKRILIQMLFAVTMAVMLSSCGSSRKRVVYIQGAEETGTFKNETAYALTIRPDDKLSIIVNCKEPDLAAPFNMQLTQRAFTHGTGSYLGTNSGSPQIFNVDHDGCIQYPTIGKLKVLGMTRSQLQDYLANYLVSNGYIQDPIVVVEFTSAKYSVLGEVTRPGQFTMSSDRVTVFDAIALAGDLTVFGERDKVRIIRENEGKQQVATLNLLDPEIIKSPYYYLQQNDVLYVEPNKSKASNREVSSLYTFGISFVGILVSVTNLIVTLTKK